MQTGWLIETQDRDGRPMWFTLSPREEVNPGWTHDSTRALRFARGEDANVYADKYLDGLGRECRCTEHIWDDLAGHSGSVQTFTK